MRKKNKKEKKREREENKKSLQSGTMTFTYESSL
jgi:hypothetical protein